MSTATWQRARTEEQIAVRVGELVEAARGLYELVPFAEITLADIAAEAGWTRSNIYKYFPTKEDLFLEVLMQDVEAWEVDAVEHFRGRSWDPVDFAREWTKVYLRLERMLQLLTIRYTVLEENCSLEGLTGFKARAVGMATRVTEMLQHALGFSEPDAAKDFFFAQAALLSGSYPLWAGSSKRQRARRQAGIEENAERPRRLFQYSLEALVHAYARPLADSESPPTERGSE